MQLFFFTLVQLLLNYLPCQLNLLLTNQKLFRKYLFLVLVAMEMMEVLAKLSFLHHYFNLFFLMELTVTVKCCGTLVFQEHQNYEINYFHLFLVLTYHIYEIIHAYLFEVLALVLAFLVLVQTFLRRKSSMFISSSSSLLPLNLKLILSSSQLLLLSLLNSSNLFWISWSLIFSSSSFTLASLTWFALTCVNKFPSNWFLMSNCF